jgi:phospholipase D1/2
MVDLRARLYLVVLLVLSVLGAVTVYVLAPDIRSRELATWLAAHRYAWYGAPLVVLAFIVLSMVPVMVLVSLTGVAFGPVLGPLYAMAGCLASASMAFGIGRWMGPRRIQGWSGARAARVVRSLQRNGTLTVFLIRKIPAPFVFVNVWLGTSVVRYREFIVGTALGMAAMVIALAGFGYHLAEIWRHPTTEGVLRGLVFLAIPLTLAWWIDRRLRARSQDAYGL